MSIKNAIRRLETRLARSSGPLVTFLIPYCKDVSQSEKIQTRLIDENALTDRQEVLIIFVTDFNMAA